jgi:aryl-alcohol dehydrogenase-like predicted oxidoreductase
MTTTTTTWTGRTRLGAEGPETSALGMGTCALGGPWTLDGRPAGWGEVDDDVSVRAVHTSLDAGVRMFDTADCYGAGHSERVLRRALRTLPAAVRSEVTVATKFGNPSRGTLRPHPATRRRRRAPRHTLVGLLRRGEHARVAGPGRLCA